MLAPQLASAGHEGHLAVSFAVEVGIDAPPRNLEPRIVERHRAQTHQAVDGRGLRQLGDVLGTQLHRGCRYQFGGKTTSFPRFPHFNLTKIPDPSSLDLAHG